MRHFLMILVAAALLLGGCAQTDTTQEQSVVNNTMDEQQAAAEDADHEVMITAQGFEPQSLTIQQGESVRWTNMIERQSWPATDNHPTHRNYPGSDIRNCFDDSQAQFDACRGLEQSESYTYTFNEAGEWEYHDHLRSSIMGTVIVQGEQQIEQTPTGAVGMEAGNETRTFVLTGENFAFFMEGERNPTLTVEQGDTVRIEFASTSGFHDWAVDEFGAATQQVMPEDGVTIVEFTADEAGEYEYYCSVGRHRENGMRGTLIVE